MGSTFAVEPTGAEHNPSAEPRKKTAKKVPPAAATTEQIKMGTVEIEVPAKLLKLAEQYREDCGKIRSERVEDAALKAAQEAYTASLNAAFERDEDFQLSLLERAEKKAKGGVA